MASVFFVQHAYKTGDEDLEEVKFIGIYSTRDKAEEAIGQLKEEEGFRDHPAACFELEEYELDREYNLEDFDDE